VGHESIRQWPTENSFPGLSDYLHRPKSDRRRLCRISASKRSGLNESLGFAGTMQSKPESRMKNSEFRKKTKQTAAMSS